MKLRQILNSNFNKNNLEFVCLIKIRLYICINKTNKQTMKNQNEITNFKVGDKCQYNKKYLKSEVIEILQILDKHCLVLFPSGFKLCTTISGLYPLQNGN